MKNKKIIIVGTGTFAEVADFYFRVDAGRDVIGFALTDNKNLPKLFKERPVLLLEKVFHEFSNKEIEIFVAIGYRRMNSLRFDICSLIKKNNFNLASYLSTKATFWDGLHIGENTFIFEDNTIQPFSKIGNGVILWSGNHIGHHSVIENWVFVSSHVVISGNCNVGEFSFLGVNSTIADGVNIGKKSNWSRGFNTKKYL